MKARLISDQDQHLVLLYSDGTMQKADINLLYNLFVRFNRDDAYFSAGSYGTWQSESCPEMSMFPGETKAIIADNDNLIISDSEPFMKLLKFKNSEPKFVTTLDYAQMHNKSIEFIKVLCRQGRIIGARKVGRSWMIPEDAPYPISEAQQREGARGPRPHTRKSARKKQEINIAEPTETEN